MSPIGCSYLVPRNVKSTFGEKRKCVWVTWHAHVEDMAFCRSTHNRNLGGRHSYARKFRTHEGCREVSLGGRLTNTHM